MLLGLSWLLSGRVLQRVASTGTLSLQGEATTFYSRDGIELEGLWVERPPTPKQPCVIICCGHSQTMERDHWLALTLAQAGFAVLQFNWRGRGNSGGKRSTFGLDEIHDLQAAIDAAQAAGMHKIGVIGFSMGASVALRSTDPRITCLITDSPMFDVPTTLRGAFRRKVGALTVLLTPIVTWMIRLRLGRSLDALHLPSALANRQLPPLLLITGGNDEVLPAEAQSALKACIRNDYTNWHSNDAGHRNAYNITREGYVSTVRRFLERHLYRKV